MPDVAVVLVDHHEVGIDIDLNHRVLLSIGRGMK